MNPKLCLYIRLLVASFTSQKMVVMEEFKHFVIVKFKEGVVVEELTKGMEKLVSEIDLVKSFEWYVLYIYLLYCARGNIILQ